MIPKQETFDIVYRALKAQGGPSVDTWPDGRYRRCRYRGEGGLKCAAGHLIPDEDYRVELEDGPADGIGKGYVKGPGWWGHDLELVLALQEAHDYAFANADSDSAWLEDWEDRMRSLAEEWGLKVPDEDG